LNARATIQSWALAFAASRSFCGFEIDPVLRRVLGDAAGVFALQALQQAEVRNRDHGDAPLGKRDTLPRRRRLLRSLCEGNSR
jgi:hypothetical protein